MPTRPSVSSPASRNGPDDDPLLEKLSKQERTIVAYIADGSDQQTDRRRDVPGREDGQELCVQSSYQDGNEPAERGGGLRPRIEGEHEGAGANAGLGRGLSDTDALLQEARRVRSANYRRNLVTSPITLIVSSRSPAALGGDFSTAGRTDPEEALPLPSWEVGLGDVGRRRWGSPAPRFLGG